jgi:hypothetical protein
VLQPLQPYFSAFSPSRHSRLQPHCSVCCFRSLSRLAASPSLCASASARPAASPSLSRHSLLRLQPCSPPPPLLQPSALRSLLLRLSLASRRLRLTCSPQGLAAATSSSGPAALATLGFASLLAASASASAFSPAFSASPSLSRLSPPPPHLLTAGPRRGCLVFRSFTGSPPAAGRRRQEYVSASSPLPSRLHCLAGGKSSNHIPSLPSYLLIYRIDCISLNGKYHL